MHGLGDRHEIAGDVWVGNCDRSPVGDLSRERFKNRSPASKHIAKANTEVGALRLAGDPGCQTLGDALGVTEHALRIRGLVGGDVHELLNADPPRRSQHVERAENVGFHALCRVLLQHWQVFERGRVEHHFWFAVVEDGVQRVFVTDVAEQHVRGIKQSVVIHAQLDRVQCRLVAIEHQ